MTDLDRQLARGPLRVTSVWSPEPPERAARTILRRRRVAFARGASAACVCVALALLLFLPREGARVPAGATLLARAPAPVARELRFADGSLAELSSTDARLTVDADTPTRVLTRLSGGARFRVAENPARTFEVRTSELRIRVLGTVFAVHERGPERTEVLVEKGKLEVAWLGGAMTLEAGQSGVFPPASHAPTASALGELSPPAAEELASARPQRRAHRAPASAAQLLSQADDARLKGKPEQALAPLRQVHERYPRDRRAPVAAFTLGRVLLDDLGRAREAADAFARARELWPAGPLAADALAREAEARVRAGDGERGVRLAAQYVARHPEGKHAATMHKLLAR